MLQFAPITLQTLPRLAPYFAANPDRLCDGTVGGTFLWRDFYHIRWALHAGALCLMADYPEGDFTAFSYPIGGDSAAALDALEAYAHQNGLSLVFCPVSAADTARLLARWPAAAVEPCRQWYDYLYTAESLRSLAGRRYGGQRNHIHRFCRENPAWHFEVLTAENLPAARRFFEDFLRTQPKSFAAAAEEADKTREVLDNWPLYGFVGGLLYADDAHPAALALAEAVGDTLYVHTEKASLAWHGAYPMIVQQLALAHTPGPDGALAFINREDDVGDEGLRTVKLSYHPAALLEKNKVTVAGPFPGPQG